MRCLVICFLFVDFSAQAQKNINAIHTIFVEGLGAGGYYSLNYDKIIFSTDKAIYSIRLGTSMNYGYVDVNKKDFTFLFPLTINRWTSSNSKHHFELGSGITTVWGYYGDGVKVNRNVLWGLTGFIGYRYQKPDGGLILRVGWTPWYDIRQDWFYPYWAGVGIGYTFKSRYADLKPSDEKLDSIYSHDNSDIYFPLPESQSPKDSVSNKEWSDSTLWRKSNTLFVGVGGYFFISPNYGKIIYVKRSLKVSVSVGFSLFSGNKHNEKNTFSYFLPVGFNAFWGKGKHYFQTGIGVLYINTYEYPPGNITTQSETENVDIFDAFLFLGYRYQKPKGGFFLQAGWTPTVAEIRTNSIPSFGVINPFIAGIGIGYSFLPKGFRKHVSRLTINH